MDEFVGLLLSILVGVVVSLITLWLANRQRTTQERQAEERRRKAILIGIGRELQWNRSATRRLDTTNAHYMVGKLATVAFERHGADLVMIAPNCVESVFRHYSIVGTVREGIRTMIGLSDRETDDILQQQWIDLSSLARVDVANSATDALNCLNLPLELQDTID